MKIVPAGLPAAVAALDSASDRVGARFGIEIGGCRDEAVDGRVRLRPELGHQLRIFGRQLREARRQVDRSSQ